MNTTTLQRATLTTAVWALTTSLYAAVPTARVAGPREIMVEPVAAPSSKALRAIPTARVAGPREIMVEPVAAPSSKALRAVPLVRAGEAQEVLSGVGAKNGEVLLDLNAPRLARR